MNRVSPCLQAKGLLKLLVTQKAILRNFVTWEKHTVYKFRRNRMEWRTDSNYRYCRARKQILYVHVIYSGDLQSPTDCRSIIIRNIHVVPHTKVRKWMRDFRIPPQSRWELRSSGSLRSEYSSHLQGQNGLTEMSVTDSQYCLRNNQEGWRSPKFDKTIRRFSYSNLRCQKNDFKRYQAICLLTHSCNTFLAGDIQQAHVLKFMFSYLLDSNPFFA